MTTKEIIEKAVETIGDRLDVTNVYFKHCVCLKQELIGAKVAVTDFELVIFYNESKERQRNFTIYIRDSFSLELLILKLKKRILEIEVANASTSENIEVG